MTNNKERKTYIARFLTQFFNGRPYQVDVVTGDASFRRYLRVYQGGTSYILMDSDPSKVNNDPFVELNACFSQAGLRVPEILATDMAYGLLLLNDLGSEHLADLLQSPHRLAHYQSILALIPSIAAVKNSPHMKPYDGVFIQQEIEIFEQWLLGSWLGYEFDNDKKGLWQLCKRRLVENIQSQPHCTMHRDFHSRNIMRDECGWVLIDYQDAVQGPVTYDVVSLLRDCYFRLPGDEFSLLQNESYHVLTRADLLNGMSYPEYQQCFDLTGLQRHLKAAGIFVRLLLRDNKAGYLNNIIPTLNYVIEVAQCYDELQWLATWLVNEIMPLIDNKLNSLK
ncbi:phosphotransferase related to Ser/Thr protein kinase [Pseudoalteromonas sp. MSK9-3]|uniref:aminoglycoside phosphotransferase family protein n=1 Tax=Pseudoalteromonas sp. MSK9-3 TaxID=1897633 RepID=UPI000EEB2E06|nr:phosphotransferase [Pseudoalteromonas sp. MSK9-3]RJE75655.1 phosphotransferase related to Ser/Thr protein kinase [Pseudoalteromonas sp. MSK9-3]